MLEGLLGGLLRVARREKPRSAPLIGFRSPALIAPGGFWLLDFELETNTADYFPMKNTKFVDNNTDNLIEVRPNDSSKDMFTVLNRGSEVYEGELFRVRIYNRGTTDIAAGEIIVNTWNEK